MHAIGVVDHQYAGLHAADDELVDLPQIGQIDAALFGQRLGFAHLPAEHDTQGRGGEVAQPVQAGFEQVAVFVFDDAAVQALSEHAECGQCGEKSGQSRR